jgi:hypothetical protein
MADIEKQIRSNLIPQLYQKIDRTTKQANYYVKNINVIEEILKAGNLDGGGAINEQIKECKETYTKQGYEAAKQLRLNQINSAKESRFFEWWQWLTKDFVLDQNTAFSYILLKMAFDGSKEKEKDPTFKINAKAVSVLENKIRSSRGQPFNIKEAYQGILNDLNAGDMEPDPVNPGNGWLRIKSKINDPEGYEENLQKLIDYSTPNGWCTAAGYGVDYLKNGDFWLYLENNQARVAIRFAGDSIAEIRGQRNESPFEYLEPILSFIQKKKFKIPENLSTYTILKEAQKTNTQFENGTIHRPLPNFERYRHLTNANKAKVPKTELDYLIESASRDVDDAYSVAQWFNFDESKIGNPHIVEKITEEKKSNDDVKRGVMWWTWPPWKWVMSVRFRLERIPAKIIECIAANDFTSLEFAKWMGYNKESIPQPIIDKIASDPMDSLLGWFV